MFFSSFHQAWPNSRELVFLKEQLSSNRWQTLADICLRTFCAHVIQKGCLACTHLIFEVCKT